MMIHKALTCTGLYAILILYGVKRMENRSAWPEPYGHFYAPTLTDRLMHY